MYRILLVCLVCFVMAGCGGPPKIDASTDETLKTSLEKVRQSLPADQQKPFDDAFGVLMLAQLDLPGAFANALAGNTPVPSEVQTAKMKAVLQGKTGAEVIAEAKTVKERMSATATAQAVEAEAKRKAEAEAAEAKKKAEALKEIADLEQKRAKAEEARAQLAKFEVSGTRYSKQQEGFLTRSVLELTVKNGTGSPVSRAYFTGTYASAGRSVPWLKAPFNYTIPGGLEPGEQVTWKLLPNIGSDWDKVAVQSDAVLTVTVDRLDGPDGKTLFSVSDFTDKDQERLDALKKQYGQP